MNREDNLISLADRTEAERRAIATKGNEASLKSRRERKQLQKELLAILEDGDVRARVCTALVDKALSGDVRAFQILRDTVGERPLESVSLSASADLQSIRDRYPREILELYKEQQSLALNGAEAKYLYLAKELVEDEEDARRDLWEAMSNV